MIVIVPESPDRIDAIAQINRQAFGGEEEVDLVAKIRDSEYFIPELSLIALVDGEPVGHIMFSPVHVVSLQKRTPLLSLAPMAVHPEHQRKGIGSKLVEQGLAAAKSLGHRAVIVIGHPGYYPRFGFMPASAFRIASPFDVPDEAFMALELEPGALKGIAGTVEYSPPFGGWL
jgi:putative acetyltransferase